MPNQGKARTDATSAIHAEGLGKCYHMYDKPMHRLLDSLLPGKRRHREFWALRDVYLDVPHGATVGIIGENGAAKSTLLKLLFVAERPTRGQILVNGRNVATLKPRQIPLLRRQVGVIFQDFKLINNRTVHENVAYALHVVGVPEKEIRRRVYQVLKGVGL